MVYSTTICGAEPSLGRMAIDAQTRRLECGNNPTDIVEDSIEQATTPPRAYAKEVPIVDIEQTPRAHQTRLSHDVRRERLLQAVVDVCSAEGIGKLSVSNVTRQAGCTRSLFYHYFPSKEAALEAALDYTIDSFIEQLRDWNTRRVPGDIEGALEMFVEQLRNSVIKTPKLSYTIAVGSNAALFADFVDRVAARCARYICDTTLKDFKRRHAVRIDHIYETLYILISGLIMFVRNNPDASPSMVKDIVASTLHIDDLLKA